MAKSGRSDVPTRRDRPTESDDVDGDSSSALRERVDELEDQVENQQQTLRDLVRMVNDLQGRVEE